MTQCKTRYPIPPNTGRMIHLLLHHRKHNTSRWWIKVVSKRQSCLFTQQLRKDGHESEGKGGTRWFRKDLECCRQGVQRHREVKKKSWWWGISLSSCMLWKFFWNTKPSARQTAWGAVPSKCIQVAVWIIPSALLEHRPGKQQQQQQIWVAGGASIYTRIYLLVPSTTANAGPLYKVNMCKNTISHYENCMWRRRASY